MVIVLEYIENNLSYSVRSESLRMSVRVARTRTNEDFVFPHLFSGAQFA